MDGGEDAENGAFGLGGNADPSSYLQPDHDDKFGDGTGGGEGALAQFEARFRDYRATVCDWCARRGVECGCGGGGEGDGGGGGSSDGNGSSGGSNSGGSDNPGDKGGSGNGGGGSGGGASAGPFRLLHKYGRRYLRCRERVVRGEEDPGAPWLVVEISSGLGNQVGERGEREKGRERNREEGGGIGIKRRKRERREISSRL